MKYSNRREVYLSIMDTDYKASNIWEDFRKDFGTKKSTVRGYGLSAITESRRRKYNTVNVYLNHLFKSLNKFVAKTRSLFGRICSLIILGDIHKAQKYSLDKYEDSIYEEELLKQFVDDFAQKNIGFSHHTLKVYYYLKTLKEHIGVDYFSNARNILEVGAGMFNFGHLISQDCNEFNYVICDLPEMIASAHLEITENYIPNSSGNYEVFLPNEISEFKASKSKRKILFVEAGSKNDISSLGIKFDLCINHESFAEMDIATVNEYLALMDSCMCTDGYINLVNRFARLQTSEHRTEKQSLNNITCFLEYNLSGFVEIFRDLDHFRDRVPKQREEPNVYYIGKKERELGS